MFDHFKTLDIKVLQCQAYLKAVRSINTDETRVWSEQVSHEMWKICTNGKTCWVLGNELTGSGFI